RCGSERWRACGRRGGVRRRTNSSVTRNVRGNSNKFVAYGDLAALFCARALHGRKYIVHREVLLPHLAILRVVAGAMQTQKSNQALEAELTSEHFESVPVKFLVGHAVDCDQGRCS